MERRNERKEECRKSGKIERKGEGGRKDRRERRVRHSHQVTIACQTIFKDLK
jgi:hypothetical protein